MYFLDTKETQLHICIYPNSFCGTNLELQGPSTFIIIIIIAKLDFFFFFFFFFWWDKLDNGHKLQEEGKGGKMGICPNYKLCSKMSCFETI